MTNFLPVCPIAELPAGERALVEIDGRYVVIFNVAGRYYAIEDRCTHDDGPLADGVLLGTQIECPRHGAHFDITNGAVMSFPAVEPVGWYETRVVDDQLEIASERRIRAR